MFVIDRENIEDFVEGFKKTKTLEGAKKEAERFYSFKQDYPSLDSIEDLEMETVQAVEDYIDNLFIEECLENKIKEAEMDFIIVEYKYNDELEKVIVREIPYTAEYEYEKSEFDQHNTLWQTNR